MHRHARGALHQRFEDDRRGLAGVRLEVSFQHECSAESAVFRRLARRGEPPVRTGHDRGSAQQRLVRRSENRHVGHAQRTDGFTVIALRHRDEPMLVRLPAVAPEMRTHLERDLGRGCAVGGIERVPETATGKCGETFRQFDHRWMRAAGQDDMLHAVQLRLDRRDDARLAMTEQVDPPRADGIEIALAVCVDQPGAFAAHHRHQRPGLVRLHLRARMPHGAQAARNQRGIRRRDGLALHADAFSAA